MGNPKRRRFGKIGRQGWTYTDDVRAATRFFITQVARQGSVDLDSDLIPVLQATYGYKIVRSFLLNCLTMPGKGFRLEFDGRTVSVDVVRGKRKSQNRPATVSVISVSKQPPSPEFVH